MAGHLTFNQTLASSNLVACTTNASVARMIRRWIANPDHVGLNPATCSKKGSPQERRCVLQTRSDRIVTDILHQYASVAELVQAPV